MLISGAWLSIKCFLEAVFEHITSVLQSATGYMVFVDMRMRLGDHLRKLPMDTLQKEILERSVRYFQPTWFSLRKNVWEFCQSLYHLLFLRE